MSSASGGGGGGGSGGAASGKSDDPFVRPLTDWSSATTKSWLVNRNLSPALIQLCTLPSATTGKPPTAATPQLRKPIAAASGNGGAAIIPSVPTPTPLPSTIPSNFVLDGHALAGFVAVSGRTTLFEQSALLVALLEHSANPTGTAIAFDVAAFRATHEKPLRTALTQMIYEMKMFVDKNVPLFIRDLNDLLKRHPNNSDMIQFHSEMRQLLVADAFDRYLFLTIKQRLAPYTQHVKNLGFVVSAFKERRDHYQVTDVKGWINSVQNWCDDETKTFDLLSKAAETSGKKWPPPPASLKSTFHSSGGNGSAENGGTAPVPPAWGFPALPNPLVSCAEGYHESANLMSTARGLLTTVRHELAEYERYTVLYHSQFGEIERHLSSSHSLSEDVYGFCELGKGLDRDVTLTAGVPRLIAVQESIRNWLKGWKSKTDYDPILKIGVDRLIDRCNNQILTPGTMTQLEKELSDATARQTEQARKQSSSEMASAQRLIASALSTAAAAANLSGARVVDVLGVKLPNSVRIIPFEDLKLNKKLGAGSFGEGWLGVWKKSDVVVKVLPGGRTDSTVLKQIEEEIALLDRLSRHPHIVQLYGVCVAPTICMVLRYANHGTAEDVLVTKKQFANHVTGGDAKSSLVVSDLRMVLQMAIDTASAMAFIHSESPPVIHRDLALRNLLVDAQYRIWLNDFGMSRSVQSTHTDGKTEANIGPVKWMAPEALREGKYSTKSDVWMFGVVIWEMFARAVPYGSDTPTRVILQVTTNGHALPMPDYWPLPIKQLINSCCSFNPDSRPDMSSVHSRLLEIFHSVPAPTAESGGKPVAAASTAAGGGAGGAVASPKPAITAATTDNKTEIAAAAAPHQPTYSNHSGLAFSLSPPADSHSQSQSQSQPPPLAPVYSGIPTGSAISPSTAVQSHPPAL